MHSIFFCRTLWWKMRRNLPNSTDEEISNVNNVEDNKTHYMARTTSWTFNISGYTRKSLRKVYSTERIYPPISSLYFFLYSIFILPFFKISISSASISVHFPHTVILISIIFFFYNFSFSFHFVLLFYRILSPFC